MTTCIIRASQPDPSNTSSGPVDTEAFANAVVENDVILLKDLMAQLQYPPIRTYKMISSITPGVRLYSSSETMGLAWAGSDYLGGEGPTYTVNTTYTAPFDYKLCGFACGRILSIRAEFSGVAGFVLTDLDVELVATGRR